MDSSSEDSAVSQQQQLEDVAELLRLQETNPAEFESFVQMATDAAKLAQEQPDVFASLVEGGAGVNGRLMEDTENRHRETFVVYFLRQVCRKVLADVFKRSKDAPHFLQQPHGPHPNLTNVPIPRHRLAATFGTQTLDSQQGDVLTEARTEQLRALESASEARRGTNRIAGGDINLPARGTLGSTGASRTPPGIVISPRPGFVIKTKVLESGVKVFINVCQHGRIGESGMTKKLDDEGNEVEGLNIPMSVGPPTVDRDNAGVECVVYDVIINPNAVAECKTDKTGSTRDWLCHLALQSVMTKHGCQLDNKYKLPKLTFKGNKEAGPAQQRIRDTSAAPQIQEVDPNAATGRSMDKLKERRGKQQEKQPKEAVSSTPLKALKPTITAVWTQPHDAPVREEDVTSLHLQNTVRTPWQTWPDTLVVTANGLRTEDLSSTELLAKIDLQASAFECAIKADGHHPLQLRFPYTVLPDTASARTNAHDGTLTLTVEVEKAPPEASADAGSKPWLLAQALRDDDTRMAPKSSVGTSKDRGGNQETRGTSSDAAAAGEVLPEERFHLKLPKGVDQYTGLPDGEPAEGHPTLDGPIRESDLLPEERFHRADMVSQHMIETREQQRKEKIERADKEREERKSKPQDGVEYVDFDDYRPGGKLGPSRAMPSSQGSDGQHEGISRDDFAVSTVEAAARVLKKSVADGQEEGGADTTRGIKLSAPHWSTLLD